MSNSITLTELHQWRRISSTRAIRDIAATWLMITCIVAGLLLIANDLSHWWLWLAASPIIGGLQNRLTTLLHDAMHRTLHPTKSTSDFIGRWFCGYPVGNFFFINMIMHKHHHQQFAGQKDPNVLAYTVNKETFLKADLIRSFFLINLLSALLNFNQKLANKFRYSEKESAIEDPERFLKAEAAKKDYLRLILLHTTLLGLCVASGVWYLYIYWVLVRITWCSAFNSIRLFTEHHSDISDASPILANNLKPGFVGWLERFFIAPLNFNLHGTHHVAPFVPYYLLPALTDHLQQYDEDYFIVRRGYFAYLLNAKSYAEDEQKLSAVEDITT